MIFVAGPVRGGHSRCRYDRNARHRYQIRNAATGSASPAGNAAMLEAYDTSGLSDPKFAQLHGFNYQTFDGTGTWLEAVVDRRGKIGRDR